MMTHICTHCVAVFLFGEDIRMAQRGPLMHADLLTYICTIDLGHGWLGNGMPPIQHQVINKVMQMQGSI